MGLFLLIVRRGDFIIERRYATRHGAVQWPLRGRRVRRASPASPETMALLPAATVHRQFAGISPTRHRNQV